ncbi:MAG: hypothetical protein WD638_03435 [Nitriliruptoraceae bacterium]
MAGGADRSDPIPGLEPSRRRWYAFLVVLAIVLGVALATTMVPRTLVTGETELEGHYVVRVTPGILAPTLHIHLGEARREVRGERWPGTASASVLHLAGQHTVIVGSAPLNADSVRVTTADRGVVEAQVHRKGWHKVHVSTLPAAVAVTEVVAIGADGRILDVAQPDEPVEVERTP